MKATTHIGRPHSKVAVWQVDDAYTIAHRLARKIPYHDRADLTHDILLLWLRKQPKSKAIALGMGKFLVLDYWQKLYYRGVNHNNKSPNAYQIVSLDRPWIIDDNGRTATLGQMLPDLLSQSYGESAILGLGKLRLSPAVKATVAKIACGHRGRCSKAELANLKRFATRWLRKHPSYARMWNLQLT